MSALDLLSDIAKDRITVTGRQPGHAHVMLWGTCLLDVTVEEVRARFYHSYFGGRDAWVDGKGNWSAVVHTD